MSYYNKLITIANQYIGTKNATKEGDQLISKWLKNVGLDLKNENHHYNPYCAAFIISCLKETHINKVHISGSCLDIWHKTPIKMRTEKPFAGCIFIWDFGNGSGHTGLITDIIENKMLTIEGNTTESVVISSDEHERNGGFVARKKRNNKIGMIGKIKLLGFIDPFAII